MKITSGILISLVLLLGVNGDNEDDYDNDYDSDSDYDHSCEASDDCDYYSSMDESCACHTKKFPSETLEERYGENVQKCCDSHGYKYRHYCDV